MTIGKYISTLAKPMRECKDIAERNALQIKLDYARAYAKGTLATFRDRAIEREIGKTYTVGAQIATLYNRDVHPDEYEAYQRYRAECKSKVDADMATLATELEAALTH